MFVGICNPDALNVRICNPKIAKKTGVIRFPAHLQWVLRMGRREKERLSS